MGSKHKAATVTLFATLFLAELAWGTYVAHIRNVISGDAISRVANAFYVLYSRDPHLGAIGFVWNPLPSMLELIPLLLWRWIPALAGSGLAAVVVSAAFTAGAAAMIYHCLRIKSLPVPFALAAVLFFACNPFVFVYGSNGMSEMMFSFFLVWCVVALTQWLSEHDTSHLGQVGIALAGAFWMRYEAVAFGVAAAAVIALSLYTKRRPRGSAGSAGHLQSALIIALTPPVFSGLIWILLNYLIMNDPLYFMRSGYSNTAFVQDLSDDLLRLRGNVLLIIPYVLRMSMYFILPLLTVLLVRALTGRLWRKDTVYVLLLTASIPLMQSAMLYQGSSYGWLRFFVYPMIIAAAWLPYEWSQLRTAPKPKLHMAILCAGLLFASFVWNDMNDLSVAPEEYGSFHLDSNGSVNEMLLAKRVAAFIDDDEGISSREGELVLADSFSSFHILVNSLDPKQYVITNDRNFREALLSPRTHGIGYILVSKMEGATLQVIHEQYPELFHNGYAWTELTQDFEGEFRLYRIKPLEQQAR